MVFFYFSFYMFVVSTQKANLFVCVCVYLVSYDLAELIISSRRVLYTILETFFCRQSYNLQSRDSLNLFLNSAIQLLIFPFVVLARISSAVQNKGDKNDYAYFVPDLGENIKSFAIGYIRYRFFIHALYQVEVLLHYSDSCVNQYDHTIFISPIDKCVILTDFEF